ncbi:hypothetical protein [Delftia tsuruhatensis]|uniref:hypothetical protein n=1 Tax=Delftia tsuruhatensis TaxID=180282 RepID=UPI0031D137F9
MLDKTILTEQYHKEIEARDYIYQRANLGLFVIAGCITMNGYVLQRMYVSDLFEHWVFLIIYFAGVLCTLVSILATRSSVGKYEHAHLPGFEEMMHHREELIEYNKEIFWINANYGRFIEKVDVDSAVENKYCELVGRAVDINAKSNRERIRVYHWSLNFGTFAVIISCVSFSIFTLMEFNRDSPISDKPIHDRKLVEAVKELNNILRSSHVAQ